MITTDKEASSSKTYAEQALRGLDALDAKLKGCLQLLTQSATIEMFVLTRPSRCGIMNT